MRLFIAIVLSDALRDALGALQRDLRAAGGPVSWVKPENIHLTLKFLGEVPPAREGLVREAMAEAVAGLSPFTLRAGGCGAFPGGRNPRVLWVGLRAGGPEAATLAARVEAACAARGFPPENRAFRGHLTLGRVRGSRGLEETLRRLQAHAEDTLGETAVDRIVLYESRLHPAGSIYTARHARELPGGGP
ncbi:MAG TPA: RNA 2',3'-cyclic phosphodiesterase [Candidatus Methylomirabilis sp.]|nr:RNA 2',3'-cyclic phosphodiesterase [Candidatus Methylomirabilis sp.]